MSKQIEQSVSDAMAVMQVSVNIQHSGLTKREEWECDAWRITFRKPGNVVMEAEFFTGLGHRVAPKPKSWHNVQSPRERSRWEKENAMPVAPHAASVLYSLLLDGDALNYNFGDWCADFGYSDDSLKDITMYNACCEIGRKLAKFFTRDELTQLRELLQDY